MDKGAAARFRGNANNSNCSARYLNANNAVSNANRNNAGSAKVTVFYVFRFNPSCSWPGVPKNIRHTYMRPISREIQDKGIRWWSYKRSRLMPSLVLKMKVSDEKVFWYF